MQAFTKTNINKGSLAMCAFQQTEGFHYNDLISVLQKYT